MSDNVSNSMQLDCMDLFDWDAWELPDWVGVERDAAQVGHEHRQGQPEEDPAALIGGLGDTRLLPSLWYPHYGLDSPDQAKDVRDASTTLDKSTAPVYALVGAVGTHASKPDADLSLFKGMPSNEFPSESTSLRETPNKPHRRNLELPCPENDCTHNGTFRRQYELDRHILVKHGNEKPFLCPYKGCFKGVNISRFARPDKLTAHIRSVHRRQTARPLQCPIGSCHKPLMELDLLGMHIRKAHLCYGLSSSARGWLTAIRNAASSDRPHCPIWSCSSTPSLLKLIPHLLTEHSEVELDSVVDQLREANYVLMKEVRIISAGNFESSAEFDNTQPNLRIHITCPICTAICQDHGAFESHFGEHHAISSNAIEHFRSWKQHLIANSYATGEEYRLWTDWIVHLPVAQLLCPHCGECFKSGWGERRHHLAMLAGPGDVKLYRRAILRLYPDFATHPVWNDLA